MTTPPSSSSTPADFARIALRRIAEQRLPPTPETFARCYYEAAGAPPLPPPAPPPAAAPAALDARLVQRFDELVDRAAATTEQLASGLDRGSGEMAASLDGLIEDAPAADAVQLLQAIVVTARDMHATMKASHAELVDTRRSLVEIKTELAESRKLLGQDALTGTENRRAMDAILEREIARARRDGEPLAVAMVDLDHFKQINDSHGHAAGDAALVHLTQVAKSMLRGNDAFIRYGGEEFLLVLPETGLHGGVHVAGRLQTLLERTPLMFEGKTIVLRFSAGVSALRDGDTEGTLIRRADEALYEAKRSGRNRVVAGE